MSCPYKHYNPNMKCWWCSIVYQQCPESLMDGFDFNECSTYKEEKLK